MCAKGYNLDTRTIIAQKITQCWDGEITGESRANLRLKLWKKFTKILNPKIQLTTTTMVKDGFMSHVDNPQVVKILYLLVKVSEICEISNEM